MDLWFRPVDPTLPVPWTSVTDDSSGMVFYWNPETNVSQYEYPNPPPPPPPPPDHYRFPFKYTPTFPSSALTYRPPDYPASYMPELPVAPVYTSPIFLPHPAPPSVVFSASIDVPQIPHSYTTNPNFQDPQIYSPPSYKQNSWVFDSENRLRFNDPHQVSPYEIDLGPDLNVHTAPTAGNVFSKVRGVRHTSPKMSLKSVRAKHKLAVCSHVRMKRKAPSVSFCQRRQRNQVLPSFSAAPSLSLAPLPQAHEQTFPTNREQHLLNTNHSAGPERLLSLKPIGSGAPKHLVDSEDVEGVNPNPQVELGHVLVVGDSCCHESLARTVFLLPGAEVDAERELFDALLHANIVDSDLGVGHTATEAGFRVGFVLDICYSDVTAEQGQGYQQFQFDVLSLVGNQPWVPHAIQMFDGMPKRRIKDPMPNFLTLDLMEQFKSGLALNEYTSCALRALRAIRMLRFLFDEGGDLRELQIVEAVFRQLCQLTETSIKIVSDQLSIVDITLLYPVSLELTLLALEWSKLHITRPLILILTIVFLPFEDFSIICRHFQTVSSKENMVYHFKVSYTVDVRLMPLMTHTHFLPYEDIILALTSAYWSSEAMHLRKFIATSFHKSGLLNNDFALIVLHLHLKPVEKFMEIFENVWISWMTLLISMNHKGALNMASLIKLQRLLPFTGVKFKYNNPVAATYFSSENQRHVCLIFRINSIALRTAFEKYWDSEDYVTWCHFNVTCNVDLMAAMFVTHTTHVFLMERYFSGPTTSMSPTHVQPPVTTFVHGLLFHLHKHELDNASVGMITQVAATLSYWLNVNVLFIAKWVEKHIVFVSLFTWNEVLSITFVVADLFCHHAKVQVPLANMRAILEFGRWFSRVYMEIITNGWKLYYVRRECNYNTLLITLALVNMINILYGEGIQPLLSRGGQGSNNTEWKRNVYLLHIFTYAVQSNEPAVIWFLTSDGASAAWIRPVCLVVDQRANYRMLNLEVFAICIYERRAIFQQAFSYVARLFALLKLNRHFSSRYFSDLIPSRASVDVQLTVHRILHDRALQIRGHASNLLFTTKGYPHVVICIIVDDDKGSLNIIFLKVPAPLIIWDSDDSHHEKSGRGEIQDLSFVLYGGEWRPMLREVHLIGWLLGHIIPYFLRSARLCVQIVGNRDIDTRHLNSCQHRLDDIAMWETSLAVSEVGAVAQKISPFKPITSIFVGTIDAFGLFKGYDLRQFFKTVLPGQNKLNGFLIGDATTPIILLLNATKISVLQLFSSLSQYLAKLHDFMLAGYELMIFGFWEYTLKLILNMIMVHHWTNWRASFPDCCCMRPSQFERLEDKPHLKGVGLMRL